MKKRYMRCNVYEGFLPGEYAIEFGDGFFVSINDLGGHRISFYLAPKEEAV